MLTALTLALGLVLPPVPFDQARAGEPNLAAQATASSRPKECAPSGKRAKKITVWQRVRFPKLVPYCDHVARAHALLQSDPAGALAAADAADKAWPGKPGASVARGRALLAQNKAREALSAFDAAQKLDAEAIADPISMRDFARALVIDGRTKEAAETYRVLVPRTQLLDADARAHTLLEAAFASMTLEAASEAPVGPEGKLAEALAFLHEVREDESSPLRAHALVALALVHDRRGDTAKATGLAAEAAALGVSVDSAPWVATPADAHALRALALEARDTAQASEAWSAYLAAAGTSPYAAAARARQAELKKKGGGGPPKKKKDAKR